MQLSFGNSSQTSQAQHGPFDDMNTAVASVANYGRLATSIVVGAAASLKSVVDRKEAIDFFEKSGLKSANNLEGKELVKHLTNKKLIDSMPKAIIKPFICFGALTLFTLNILAKMYPNQQKQD